MKFPMLLPKQTSNKNQSLRKILLFNLSKDKKGIIVLPYEMYDHESKEITGRPIEELELFYNTKIWKA